MFALLLLCQYQFIVHITVCVCVVCYLAKEVDVETKRLGIPWAGIHVIADQQHQLQEFA